MSHLQRRNVVTVGRGDTQGTGRVEDVQTGPHEVGPQGRKMIADVEAPHGSVLQAHVSTPHPIASDPLAHVNDPPVLASVPLWSANPLQALASVPQFHANALLLLPRGQEVLESGHPLPGPNLAGAPPDPQAPTLSLPVVPGLVVDPL